MTRTFLAATAATLICPFVLAATGRVDPPQIEPASVEWRVRDVDADSVFSKAGSGGRVPNLKLKLNAKTQDDKIGKRTFCTVVDETGRERAVTLAMCLSLPEGNWDP